jgi:DNA-binding XRE family transcriptional regulator
MSNFICINPSYCVQIISNNLLTLDGTRCKRALAGGRYERDEVKPSIETATKIAEALEVSLDYLTGLSDLELDKTIVDTIMDIQQLDSKDKVHIMTTISALVRDAKARNTYA